MPGSSGVEWIKDISVHSSDKAFPGPLFLWNTFPWDSLKSKIHLVQKLHLLCNTRELEYQTCKQLLLRAEGEQLQLPRAIIPAAQGVGDSQGEALMSGVKLL